MTGPADPHARLVGFLLGSLPQAEHEEVEERVFSDDQLQEELAATTDDLIHAYLAGALSDQERAQFETHFLASGRHRERLAFIRDLLSAVGGVTPQAAAPLAAIEKRTTRPAVWWSLAAALVAAAIALFLMRPSSRGSETARGVPSSPASSVPSETPPAPHPEKGEPIQDVRLPRMPASGPTDVTLSREARTLRLEVAVADGPPSYDVIVRKPSGSEVWRAEGLTTVVPGAPLVVPVPAEILASGDYVLSIEGEVLRGTPSAAPLVEHRLRVVRRP